LKDYATFKKDGIVCKEEILFWRQTDSNPLTIRFLTPTGLYKYEQTKFSDEEIKGVNRLPKVIQNHFYKLNGTDEECYLSYSRIEKEIYARWQPISNLESFTISLPN
jgi:hypothetical protein